MMNTTLIKSGLIRSVIIKILLLAVSQMVSAQQRQKVYKYPVVKPSGWVLPASGGVSCRWGKYSGANALLISKQISNYKFACIAYPKDISFRDGVIEADLSATSWRDFLGLAFRIRDMQHYECLYFRPAYSGTVNAVQYMPAKKADFNWWDFEAERYQASAVIPKTSWFHVKLVVRGRVLTVYINRQPNPVMVYRTLDPQMKRGSVGFWFGNSYECAYKNLIVINY